MYFLVGVTQRIVLVERLALSPVGAVLVYRYTREFLLFS